MRACLAAAITGLLFATTVAPVAFASDVGLSFTTYEAWYYGGPRHLLATSSIEDVSGDKVDDLILAGRDKTIYLVDGATGKKVWAFTASESYLWTTIMEYSSAGDVLAATANQIYMIDGTTGNHIWNFTAGTTNLSDPCFPAIRSLHAISDVDGDGLPDVAVVAGSGDHCTKNDKILVLALSAGDGSKIWGYSYEVDYSGLKDGTRGSSPAAAIDLDKDGAIDVAVIDDQSIMHVVDGKTGEAEMIQLDVFGMIWNLMVVPDISGDGVQDTIAFEFVKGGGGPDYASIDAINLATAQEIWHVRAGDGQYSGGALYSAALVSGTETDYIAVTKRIESDLQLVVLSVDTGDEAWKFNLGKELGGDDLAKYYPVTGVADLKGSEHGEIAVGAVNSKVYLLDGEKGSTIWSHPIDYQISELSSIELQDGQAYVVVEDQEDGLRALAGLTEIPTKLEISISTKTLTLTPLPDKITVSGTITPPFRGEVVELQYVDPSGKTTTVPLLLEWDGSFVHIIEPEIVGTWKVIAQFEGEGHYLSSRSTATFTVTKGGSEQVTSNVYRLEVEGSNASYPIAYQIKGGNVTSMSVDEEEKSLDIAISATQDGILDVRLPRIVIDALESDYQVYVDGKATEFEETEADEQFRTLSIPFSEGASEVVVSGTYIVPEFPAMIVLVLAIVVVVAASVYVRRLSMFNP